jgi:hypothetical protein
MPHPAGRRRDDHRVRAARHLVRVSMQRIDCNGHVLAREAELRSGLEQLLELPVVGDVRGLGFYYAIELKPGKADGPPCSPEDHKKLFGDDSRRPAGDGQRPRERPVEPARIHPGGRAGVRSGDRGGARPGSPGGSGVVVAGRAGTARSERTPERLPLRGVPAGQEACRAERRRDGPRLRHAGPCHLRRAAAGRPPRPAVVHQPARHVHRRQPAAEEFAAKKAEILSRL